MQLQKIKYQKVLNLTTLGLRVQQFCKQNLFRLHASGYDFGWSDGGCGILAHGVQEWSKKVGIPTTINFIQLYPGSTEKHVTDHVVVRLDANPFDTSIFIDADGISTEVELLRKWHALERPEYHKSFLKVGTIAGPNYSDIPHDEELSWRIAMELNRVLDSKEKVWEYLSRPSLI